MSTSLSRRRGAATPSPVLACLPAAIGIALVLAGWVSVSGHAAFDGQTKGVNVAIAGAVVVFAGCGFYLWAFRRRIGSRMAALRAATVTGEEF